MSRIDPALKDRMASSLRRGCPVPRSRLRYVTVAHVGFDGAAHQGELVVHRAVAADVTEAFRQLYALRFPVRRMRLVGRVSPSVRRAFAGIGWSWGGTWTDRKDDQHVSATGR